MALAVALTGSETITLARPILPLGTFGKIRTYPEASGAYRAMTLFRDFDGVTRSVERHGKTGPAAERALRASLRDRVHAGIGADITRDTPVTILAETWWTEFSELDKSPGTLRVYRDRLDNQVIPALGALRVRELTPGAVDRFLTAVKKANGPSVAKLARSVLSGMCRLAVRHDALDRNPVRETAGVTPQPQSPPRALSLPELQQLRALLTYDAVAVRRDLPFLVSMLLATGLRIGECLAIVRDAVDLDAATLEVRGTVIRIKGLGLLVKPSPKSKAGFRKLELPTWIVTLLRQRFSEPRVAGQPIPVLDGTEWGSVLVFPSTTGRLRDPSNVEGWWREAVQSAGFDWVKPHTLRKTLATLMDQQGISARAIADQLGQANPSITLDVYLGRKISYTGAAGVVEALG